MGKNTLSTFAFVLLIAATMWFYHMNREGVADLGRIEVDAQSMAEASSASTSSSPTSAATPVSARPLSASASTQASNLSGELQTLEQRLADAQSALEEQRQSYQQISQQSQVVNSRSPASEGGMNVIRSENQIENTMLELNSYRNFESDINRQANDQLREQSSATQMQLQQLDENIRVQQNLIRQSSEELAYWRGNGSYVNEQQAQIARLQDLLASQGQQLELMHQQRLLVSAESLSQAQSIQLQKQQALAGVAADREAAYGDVESLRDSIIRLQQSQREIRSSQVSIGSQLRQAQTNLQSQENQVRTLQGQVQQKRQELESLLR